MYWNVPKDHRKIQPVILTTMTSTQWGVMLCPQLKDAHYELYVFPPAQSCALKLLYFLFFSNDYLVAVMMAGSFLCEMGNMGFVAVSR